MDVQISHYIANINIKYIVIIECRFFAYHWNFNSKKLQQQILKCQMQSAYITNYQQCYNLLLYATYNSTHAIFLKMILIKFLFLITDDH